VVVGLEGFYIFKFTMSFGSFRGIFRLSKCLSKDIMASALTDKATAYCIASSMSKPVSLAMSTAFTFSLIDVLYT